MHIGFVGNDRRRGDRSALPRSSSRLPIVFMTIAHSSTDIPSRLSNLPRHQAPTQRMILAMNGITDVVQIAGNVRQLRRTLRLP